MNKPLNEYKVGDQVIVILKWGDASSPNKDVEGVVVETGNYVENWFIFIDKICTTVLS